MPPSLAYQKTPSCSVIWLPQRTLSLEPSIGTGWTASVSGSMRNKPWPKVRAYIWPSGPDDPVEPPVGVAVQRALHHHPQAVARVLGHADHVAAQSRYRVLDRAGH